MPALLYTKHPDSFVFWRLNHLAPLSYVQQSHLLRLLGLSLPMFDDSAIIYSLLSCDLTAKNITPKSPQTGWFLCNNQIRFTLISWLGQTNLKWHQFYLEQLSDNCIGCFPEWQPEKMHTTASQKPVPHIYIDRSIYNKALCPKNMSHLLTILALKQTEGLGSAIQPKLVFNDWLVQGPQTF